MILLDNCKNNFSLLFLLVLICASTSCGSDEEPTIFGNYELSQWELSSCVSEINNQTSDMSDRGVCVNLEEDEIEACLNIDITLSQDSTFAFTSLFVEYDLEGNQMFDESFDLDGPFNVTGNEIVLIYDGRVFRRFTMGNGGFFRTIDESFCESTERFVR